MIVKVNKAEKRPRSDLNQIETLELKQTNQGNSISGNPESVPPPVLPPVPPPAPSPVVSPIVPPIQLVQNPQVYMKKISINKPPIFTEATNKAKK